MRYFPVEWLEFSPNTDWQSMVASQTPSANPATALLTQSKRLPLVWDELQVDMPTWKKLLPETRCASKIEDGFILKPAFGRVGEGINIVGTLSETENEDIKNAATANPEQWVAQKMFESLPINGLHLNLGVFVVDGQFARLYGRTSKVARIDASASEIPVLVRTC